MQQAVPLDLFSLPIRGQCLIEASAGTGKTFTIAALYLRLLLGLGGKQAVIRKLPVEEILVVTFTEAATEELRGRIRDNIHCLRLACLRGESDEPLFQSLLAEMSDPAMVVQAAQLLLVAEQQMDEAAIYTIHGFCQRMLSQNAFESGILFNQALIQDEMPLQRQACADFWRRHCYPLPLDIAKIISKEFSGPLALLTKISPYLQGELPLLTQTSQAETLPQRHQQIINQIVQVKALWLEQSAPLEALISASDVNKRSYSRANLPKWLAQMDQWAQQATVDYHLPACLPRFAQNRLDSMSASGQGPQHPLFTVIEQLCAAEPLTLSDLLLSQALKEIRQSVQQQKLRRAEMGFDDLLSGLDSALSGEKGAVLAELIRQRYPVAMIDEFQDTDPQQYRIFKVIYAGRGYVEQEQSALLLIGDPKQAIYAFRGADIFTYISARKQIAAHYTLNINWRSSPGMVQAVNQLFDRFDNPFLFKEIVFNPVRAAEKNQQLIFEFRGKAVQPMRFWLSPGNGVGINEYQQLMSKECAAQIAAWLQAGQEGEAFLLAEEGRRPLAAADITVLVRNRNEAALIGNALNRLGIPSLYLSNRATVFATAEAQDLLWLMQAVLAPEQERLIRIALASHLFGLDAFALYQLNQDEQAWDRLTAEFTAYRKHWLQRGILPMIREVLARRHLAETILATPRGERRMTDLLHLGELLQEAAMTLESEHALVRWLARQIATPDNAGENQQLRLESDRHLVQIVTVHKSKGLDYPIVCLPFISGFRKQQQALYHDRDHLQAVLALNAGREEAAWAEEERLAEDMRLLYVALTRSIYHCSIGVAPLMTGNQKKEGKTELHQGALGYLLQGGQEGDASLLTRSLNKLCSGKSPVIEIVMAGEQKDLAWQALPLTQSPLAARHFSRQLRDEWRLTSYSSLLQHDLLRHDLRHQSSSPLLELLPRFDIEAAEERGQQEESEALFSVHTFPKGAAIGTFLHKLLEEIDFNSPIDLQLLQQQLSKTGIDESWLPLLQEWLETILTTPLSPQLFSLSSLKPENKQVEMQFYLPINNLLQSESLYALTSLHDPLSARRASLDFRRLTGMLTGFIDLLFRWQGRYYLLDYKSNWLGPDEQAYSQSAMANAICDHYYDLQYQLYTLALHRLLRHRLSDYDYQRHFGGVFYLFLRGISSQPHSAGNGIFFCRPPWELVDGMDRLFSGSGENKKC